MDDRAPLPPRATDEAGRDAPAPPATSSLIQREIPLLIALSMVAVLLFLFTRAVARWDREMTARAAAHWYESGRDRLGRGDTARALRALRQATADDPENPEYAIALANALTAAGRADEARQVLAALRAARGSIP